MNENKNKRKSNEYIFILLHVFKIREEGNEGKKKRREERRRKEGEKGDREKGNGVKKRRAKERREGVKGRMEGRRGE